MGKEKENLSPSPFKAKEGQPTCNSCAHYEHCVKVNGSAANLDGCEICKSYDKRFERVALQQHDPVNHPSHYTDGKIEVIDFIEDKKLNFHRGNAVKYISRAGKKDPTKEKEDILKAIWYLQRDVQRLDAAEAAKAAEAVSTQPEK